MPRRTVARIVVRVACGLAPLALLPPGAARADSPCLECHDRGEIGAGDRSVHPPFGEDDCGACHGDHGDAERLVLVAEGNALCGECHDPGDAELLRSHRGVRGDRVACASCHDPHRSSEPRLLLPVRHRPLAFGRCDGCHRFDGRLAQPVPQLCLGCHGGAGFSGRVTHGPLREGECLACHDPHASRAGALLRRPYAPGRAIAGEGDVALCLGCHDRESLFSPAAGRTYFRDGERNYHLLHVSPSAGRLSCRNCHEAHTSEGPRLVRRELDCGGVPCLRLDFRRGGTGGSCLSGCHAPRSYTFGAAEVPRGALAAVPPRRRSLPAGVAGRSGLEESIDRRCVACHAGDVKRFAAGARLHAPVRAGACSSCHLDHGPENRLLLLGRQDRVCATCHGLAEPELLAAHGGFPLDGSRCTECHDPHGGNAPGLLLPQAHPPFAEGDCAACHGAPAAGWRIEARNDACRDCHDGVAGEAHPHPAVAERGCRGCHRPHAAREAKLLRARGAELCFLCHDAAGFAGETVHSPVKDGDCATCHPAHGAARPRLLAQPYPLERFLVYRDDAYGLCWDCHEAGLADPADAGSTGFADGGRNLHALHVRDRVTATELGRRVQPGITCRNCHDPHASADPRLIRRTLDCDGVPCLQLEYRKAGEGGRCSGGCHDAEPYGVR